MDGRFGWYLFEGKTVEINYDNNLIIIRPTLAESLKDYTKLKLDFLHSSPCAKATFVIGLYKCNGEFMFDTGCDQAIIADSGWAARQGFFRNLKVINSAVLRDPRGVPYVTKTVFAPLLQLNSIGVANVPTLLLTVKNPSGFEVNYFGNGLVKRFNMVFDFKHDNLYLKENKWATVPFGA